MNSGSGARSQKAAHDDSVKDAVLPKKKRRVCEQKRDSASKPSGMIMATLLLMPHCRANSGTRVRKIRRRTCTQKSTAHHPMPFSFFSS
jgi:hypothetical protein